MRNRSDNDLTGRGPLFGLHGVTRRVMLGGSALAVLLHPARSLAQLLNPSVLRPGAPRVSSPLVSHSPSYAQGMAQSVLTALVSLVSAYAGTANKITSLTQDERKLRDEVSARTQSKKDELEEYRQGLFCSGCNQTRSQILSKGEQFPHPGQSIIQPTPQQIADKERQLQNAIDKAASALDKALDDRKSQDGNLTRLQKEIFEGGMLWRSAVTFEEAIVKQREVDAELNYQADRTPITQRVKELLSIEKTERDPQKRAQLTNEVVLLSARLNMLEQKRNTVRRGTELAIATADRRARNDGDRFRSALATETARITDSAHAGFLKVQSNLLTKSGVQWNTGGGRETGGRFFHMGDYGEATVTSLHPRVQRFLNDAGKPYRNGPQAYNPSAREELDQLRELATKLRASPAGGADADQTH